MKLLVEENRKLVEENRIGFEKLREAQQKTEEENRKFSVELREFKEENRIGFEKLRVENEKLNKALKKTDSHFNTQWGRLVEALVNNQVIPLLRDRGILVTQTSQNAKGCKDGRNYEFDIIAENGDTIVVIEVKTTIRVEDVKEFLDELPHFKTWMSVYPDMKVHGAVAYLREEGGAAVLAAKKGLFTILATGSSAAITNPPEFQPKEF